MNDLADDSAISHYRILEKIGAGGMGEVYLAEDIKLNRKVALKFLSAPICGDKNLLRRFEQEAFAASALNHPNILTIYEFDAEGEVCFLAAEYIEGETLREHSKDYLMSLQSALDVAIQMASALAAAHSAGIVHRDIKPDNVMIRPDGLVKILDFGIVKLSAVSGFGTSDFRLNSEQAENPESEAATVIKGTIPGMIIGTANYMSPEQAKGKQVDARTDIFSFGVALYEMLAGKLPFEGETPLETIGAILHKEPLPLNADVPTEIRKIVNKCLRKDAGERYQTIKDVCDDLKDVKQDLEFQEKLERSAVPNQDENKTQILQATTADAINQPTANQTAVSNPAKKYLAVGLAILLISAVGFGYWFFNRSGKQIESIAVLPFQNESGNPDNEYLSDGMTETLINSLSQLPNLSVKARSSVFRYKGKDTNPQAIGKELNVQAILNGRVVQRGDQLTLSLELIDAQTENVIWSESYNRKQADLVSLQSDIARDVSSKLKTKLSGADERKIAKTYTTNPEAYRLYLQGRFYWNKREEKDFRKAVEYFQSGNRA